MNKEYFNIEADEARGHDFIEHLSTVLEVSNKALESMSDNNILAYAKIEMASFPSKITVSTGMTRQKQQFCPNSYHLSMEIDLSLAKEIIISEVAAAPAGEKLILYKDLKSFLYKSVWYKYSQHESLLRQNMGQRAKADGVALPGDI